MVEFELQLHKLVSLDLLYGMLQMDHVGIQKLKQFLDLTLCLFFLLGLYFAARSSACVEGFVVNLNHSKDSKSGIGSLCHL